MHRNRLLKSDIVRLCIPMGLCLALGVYLIATTVVISKDGVFYISQARQFARDPLGVAQRYPPGYPALLWIARATAGLFARSDSVFSWVHASQSVTLVCRLLALVPLYLLGRSLIGGARAFWALLILIMLPYPAQFGSDVLRDWPYVMFLSVGLWLLYEAARGRTLWLFALAGLAAAAGYFIQPAAGQLVLYGLLASMIALRGDARCCVSTKGLSWSRRLCAATLLIAGFAVPVVPYTWATGTPVPHQLRPSTFNSPPVITSVGGRGAGREPLEFEIREDELLEIGVEAFDLQGDNLRFSLAAVPAGSRPVYQFHLTAGSDCFMTISEDEKNMLLDTYPPAVRDYDGIIGYAHARADARPGLLPVHRLWSPLRQRHFYTVNVSERDAVLAQSATEAWTYEGIAFYVFAQDRQRPHAVPVQRLRDEKRVTVPINVAGEPPAGMAIEGGALRWRPGPGQEGEYEINVIVSDGDMESCQLVKIRVIGPQAVTLSDALMGTPSAGSSPVTLPSTNPQSAIRNPPSGYSGLRRLPGAVDKLFDGFAESLMVFFLVPWGLGLYYRMRYEAGRLERVLTTAVIVVNVGLILGRYMWVSPTVERRYCLPLVALTILYVPVGLERMAHWLSRVIRLGDRWAISPDNRVAIWFHVLAMIGIGICLPKLLAPLYADTDSYVTAIQWLRDNTRPDDVTAVPDSRLTFYAQRPALLYRGEVDPRRADYIVRILEKDAKTAPPTGWSEQYSVPVNDRRGRTLVIYKTHRHKDG